MRKSFSTKMIFIPTKHTLHVRLASVHNQKPILSFPLRFFGELLMAFPTNFDWDVEQQKLVRDLKMFWFCWLMWIPKVGITQATVLAPMHSHMRTSTDLYIKCEMIVNAEVLQYITTTIINYKFRYLQINYLFSLVAPILIFWSSIEALLKQ